MNNQEKAKFIIGKLLNYGVKEFCVCAGARNTPLLQALSEEHQAHVKSFFNENSAAFYSIGRIKKTGHPSAVITTSGSAVAELLPAVMEAYFLNYPLIVVTADRPVEFRGSGAPQTVDQQHIFNSHCMKSYDLVNDDFEELNFLVPGGPIHINVCLEEPNVQSFNQDLNSFDGFSEDRPMKKPLVILSQLEQKDKPVVLDFLQKHPLPVLVEAHSNLHNELADYPHRIYSYEGFIENYIDLFDGVIRIGGVPTLRLWRDLEARKIRVKNFSRVSFSGLSYLKDSPFTLDSLNEFSSISESSWKEQEISEILFKNRKWKEKVDQVLDLYPLSEQALFAQILHLIKTENLFVSNSSPIRILDFCLKAENTLAGVYSSRGTNGIDGQVSQSMGLVSESEVLVSVLGDLTCLYDLSGFWPLRSFNRHLKSQFCQIVVNNEGGELFNKIFSNRGISPLTQDWLRVGHELSFKGIADMYELDYVRTNQVIDLKGGQFIELRPDNDQTRKVWDELKSFV